MHDVKAYNAYRKKTATEKEIIKQSQRELAKYQKAKRDIEQKSERIMRLEARINNVIRSPREIDVQSTADPKSIEDMLINAAELRKEYGSMIIEAEAICEYVERLINLADGIAGEMLYKRYIIGQGIDTIAHDFIYCRRNVYNFMDEGLLQIGKRVHKTAHLDML